MYAVYIFKSPEQLIYTWFDNYNRPDYCFWRLSFEWNFPRGINSGDCVLKMGTVRTVELGDSLLVGMAGTNDSGGRLF